MTNLKTLAILVGILVVVVVGRHYYQVNRSPEYALPVDGISTDKGEYFSGVISGYTTDCFADADCTITVDGKVVLLVAGGRMSGKEPQGELRGVESLGDLDGKIGSTADVYAAKTPSGDYTMYGNSNFYVQVR